MNLPSALSPVPRLTLQGDDDFPARCAPNSDSKKEKRRLGKDGNVLGPLGQRPSHETVRKDCMLHESPSEPVSE